MHESEKSLITVITWTYVCNLTPISKKKKEKKKKKTFKKIKIKKRLNIKKKKNFKNKKKILIIF